ncbi:MAG: hypothetical protein EZS28_026740 [Streblomastix strix]|uniref:Uncharacterized protein n=1 Tax=Streblomastix strix TaxID=222440 RepID=A0A5J4V5T8_9EUKA|nr:MAG: hypothetical protein EZS28_026740 [Streblomastix strix]
MANIDLSEWIIDDEDQIAAACFSPKQSKKRVRYYVRRTDDPRVSLTEIFLFGLQDLENTSNNVQQISQTYSGLRIGSKLIRDTLAHVLTDLFKLLESMALPLTPQNIEKQATQIISKQMGGARVSGIDELFNLLQDRLFQFSSSGTLILPFSLQIFLAQLFIVTQSPNDHENTKGQKLSIQKDDQEIKPQEEAQDSSMTKNSDRATTAEAQT